MTRQSEDTVAKQGPSPAEDLYTGRYYADKHADWHVDGKPKADDLEASFVEWVSRSDRASLRVADVGCGTGSVLSELIDRAQREKPDIRLEAIGFDISPHAIEIGRQRFANIDLRNQHFSADTGHYDMVMLVDVLEHLENPWAVLRDTRSAAKSLLVRQPLLGNFSTFRHDNYRAQRIEWGHIGHFSYRQFLDMADACGWTPDDAHLVAPWRLFPNQKQGKNPGWIKPWVHRLSPVYASFFISGYYLVGTFR